LVSLDSSSLLPQQGQRHCAKGASLSCCEPLRLAFQGSSSGIPLVFGFNCLITRTLIQSKENVKLKVDQVGLINFGVNCSNPLGANPMFVGEIRIDSLDVFRWTPEKCLDRAVRQAYRPTRFEKILYDPVL
jgi:hypothetical protein